MKDSETDVVYRKNHNMPFLQRTLNFNRRKSSKSNSKRSPPMKKVNMIEKLKKQKQTKELKFTSLGSKKRKHHMLHI